MSIRKPDAPKRGPDNGRFARVALAAIADRRISDRVFRVMVALWAYADPKGHCWPSQATIAALLGVTRQAIGPHVMALQKLGYVTLVRRTRKRGGWAANYYTLHNPPLKNGVSQAVKAEEKAITTPHAVQGQVWQR